MTDTDKSPADSRDLVITRLIDVPREKVWRAWTEAALMQRWFAPRPWTIEDVEIDVRPGGVSKFVMKGPNGEAMPCEGVFLEVVPNRKLVTTDAYGPGWRPAEKPFFTAIMTFEDEGGKTRYTARARHWRDEDRKTHEEMGFRDGWAQCAAQLEEVAKSL